MSKALNFVVFEGEILTEVSYAITDRNGDDCASFIICLDRNNTTWNKIRVNAFGESAKVCKEKQLAQGNKVIVVGEIMTRFGASKVHSNEVRMFRVFNITQDDFVVQAVRQNLSNALSLDKEEKSQNQVDKDWRVRC